MWRIAQVCAKKQGLAVDLASGSRLQAARLMHTCQACQKLKRRASCSLQDKSPRLARPFARGLNLRLNLVARSSCQNTLFGKIWLFTFLLTLLYIYPYTHNSKRVSRENFERETLEKTKLTHPQSLSKKLFKFLYSLPLHCQILERLITKTFSYHIHFLWEGCLVFWEAVRNEPISHWLMLWSRNRFGATSLEQEAWKV